jgi:hypothetical protein
MVKSRRASVVIVLTVALGFVPLSAASAHGTSARSAHPGQSMRLMADGPVATPNGGHTWCC